jgi:hypothetical protein
MIGDLAIFRPDDYYEGEDKHGNPVTEDDLPPGCIVEITDYIWPNESIHFDYWVRFPNGKVFQVAEEELEAIFKL